jgi:hypothetical protein
MNFANGPRTYEQGDQIIEDGPGGECNVKGVWWGGDEFQHHSPVPLNSFLSYTRSSCNEITNIPYFLTISIQATDDNINGEEYRNRTIR